MTDKRTNPDFLNGVPQLLILNLLASRPMHGYEIVQAIKSATASALEFGEGCIYPILHRLEAENLLDATRETVGGRSRVVYRLTRAGRARLAESVTCWQRIVRAVNNALEGHKRDKPALA